MTARRRGSPRVWLALTLIVLWSVPSRRAAAQTFTQRGVVESRGLFFPQHAANDTQRTIGDVLVREELFAKTVPWLQFAAGIDARAATHGQVEPSWRVDFRDRGLLRPRLSVRRLSATITKGAVTLDVGKQFIRWGKADIVTPTDRFAPRDFLNVVDGEFLPVTGVRAVGQWGPNTFEAAWTPFLTPSRTPRLDQRWTVVPPVAQPPTLVEAASVLPNGSQTGVRWAHAGAGYEYSLSYFDGFNVLPEIEIRPGRLAAEIEIGRAYPELRSYGGDAVLPLRWVTVKGEGAYFSSVSPGSDDYVLYVIQVERQTGEWLLLGGYAGEVVTDHRAGLTFAPDRGLTRSLVARATYTVDTNRHLALETAVRQNGHGAYVKGEYSQARGTHWRSTVTAVALGGRADDFLGQYRRNSHVTASLRYSF